MKTIGIAGPIALDLLRIKSIWYDMPSSFYFPLMAYLSNYLVTKGFKVVIYTSSPTVDQSLFYEDESYKICVCTKKRKNTTHDYIEETKEIHSLIMLHPCDVILANWTYEFALSSITSKIPTLVVAHDHAETIYNISPNNDKATKYLIDKLVYFLSVKILVVSPYLYSLLPTDVLVKCQIVSNFYPKVLEKMFVDYSNKENYFVSINNGFGIRKNVKIAIDAFVIFCKHNPKSKYKYHLIGNDMQINGPAYEYALSIQAPMDKLIFHGFLNYEEAMLILSKAKILLHTSREESFGMAALEATILGTLVIGGSESGNIPNLIKGRGVLCNIDDKYEVAKSICLSLKDRSAVEELVKKAYTLNKEYYNEDVVIPVIINEMKKLYISSLGKKVKVI